jgi:hypothetical protein
MDDSAPKPPTSVEATHFNGCSSLPVGVKQNSLAKTSKNQKFKKD